MTSLVKNTVKQKEYKVRYFFNDKKGPKGPLCDKQGVKEVIDKKLARILLRLLQYKPRKH
jgi:hypothetical protein